MTLGRIGALIAVALTAGGPPPLFAEEVAPATTATKNDRGVDVLGAALKSLNLLMIEHGYRLMLQAEVRQSLEGPFWVDYVNSLHMPQKWDDGDQWLVNYIGHPIHGAAAGFILLDHDRDAPKRLSLNRHYWATRGVATAWAAAYSLQFEVGPLGEAAIGNVGLDPSQVGWVDHVVTPIGAFGWMVGEDAIDRYVLERIEAGTGNRILKGVLRVGLNPARALSNMASGRWPWYRNRGAIRSP